MNAHVAHYSSFEPRIRKANSNPDLITEDDLSILGGALLLCLRENDNGVSREYASIAEGRDLQQDVAESLANLPVQDRNPTLEPLLITFARDPQFYEAMQCSTCYDIRQSKFRTINRNTVTPIQLQVLMRLAGLRRYGDSIKLCKTVYGNVDCHKRGMS